MTAQRRRESEQLDAVVRQLRVVGDFGQSVYVHLLPQLKELLGLEKVVASEVRLEHDTWRLAAHHSVAMPVEVCAREYDALVSASPRGWGHFNPGRPEPGHRNRAVFIAPLDDAEGVVADGAQPVLSKEAYPQTYEACKRMGLSSDWALRVLVCEGESLLAWVGGYRASPVGRREARLLQALTPALQRRLSLDRLLAQGPLARLGLAACLEELSTAAFIVDGSGHVHHANLLARARLDREPSATRKQLSDAAARGPHSDFRVTPLGLGPRPHLLLIARPEDPSGANLAKAARYWCLTPRQASVLGLLIEGQANKTIATTLDCAERTVEQHVTALLSKAGVDTRAALTAKFWKEF